MKDELLVEIEYRLKTKAASQSWADWWASCCPTKRGPEIVRRCSSVAQFEVGPITAS